MVAWKIERDTEKWHPRKAGQEDVEQLFWCSMFLLFTSD